MKLAAILLTLAVPFTFAGCSNSTEPGQATVVYPIEYTIVVTGANATVSSVQYTNSTGATVTELTPALPWSALATRSPGQTAMLVVTGTTGATSTITATIQDDPAEVTPPVTHAQQSCPENTNPCNISISNNF